MRVEKREYRRTDSRDGVRVEECELRNSASRERK